MSGFKEYVARYGIARSEGTFLRYLSDAYRVLDRTVPQDKRDDRLKDIIAWLGLVVRSVDSSLVDEWESAGSMEDVAAPTDADAVVHDRRGLTLLVRNSLFRRVTLAARGDVEQLGDMDMEWGFGARRWQEALDAFYEAHEELLLDADARSNAYFVLDESDERSQRVWHVHQIFHDADGDSDFGIMADVDLDATQEAGEAVLANYRVGFAEDILD